MDLRLKGKVAIVGGASMGIGYGIARTLAAEGSRIVVTARRVSENVQNIPVAVTAYSGEALKQYARALKIKPGDELATRLMAEVQLK